MFSDICNVPFPCVSLRIRIFFDLYRNLENRVFFIWVEVELDSLVEDSVVTSFCSTASISVLIVVVKALLYFETVV